MMPCRLQDSAAYDATAITDYATCLLSLAAASHDDTRACNGMSRLRFTPLYLHVTLRQDYLLPPVIAFAMPILMI